MSSPDDDICPVRDELLGELYRANDRFMPGFVCDRGGKARNIREKCQSRKQEGAATRKTEFLAEGASCLSKAFIFRCFRRRPEVPSRPTKPWSHKTERSAWRDPPLQNLQ
jgi:hypothetical protein